MEADISGIQKFIYNIAKTQGIEGFSIGKALRGRSFLVSMIPEIISRYIIKTLGYPILNIIYIGGGKFQLILAKKEEPKLQEIEDSINKFLLKEYQTEISLIMAYQDFSLDSLNDFGNILEKLQIRLDDKKKNKFFDDLTFEFEEKNNLCKSCRIMSCDDDKDICNLCNQSKELGNIIPKIKYLAFGENTNKNDIKRFKFGDFGSVYFDTDEAFEETLLINDTSFDRANGFRFIGNAIPIVSKENIGYFRKIVEEEKFDDIELYPDMVLPFRLLSYLTTGDKKIATFRADVDNLGLIFGDFIGQDYKLIKVASLSRMLDLFFSGYINNISKDITKQMIKDTNIQSSIYIVYSGGDDMFVIGPYDVVFAFSVRLRKEFYYYTTKNLDFGISGGIFVSSNSMPIPFLASRTEHLESISKRAVYYDNKSPYTKDSISIFEKPFKWSYELKGEKFFDELIKNTDKSLLEALGLNKEREYSVAYFDELLELSDELAKHIGQDMSKSFLHRFLILNKLYVSKNRKNVNPIIYPKIYYQIARNVKSEDLKNFLMDILIMKGYKNIDKKDIIKNLDVIAYIVLIKTRKAKEVVSYGR